MIAMWSVWLLAIYGLSTILVDLMKQWNGYYRQVPQDCVHVLVYNSETRLEDTIRTLNRLSRMEGRPIQIVVYDFGSTDNTEKMIRQLQRYYVIDQKAVLHEIELVGQEQTVKTIDLRQARLSDSMI